MFLIAALLLLTPILVAACFHSGPGGNSGIPTPEDSALKIRHNAPAKAKVGVPFTVELVIQVKKSTPAVSVKEQLSGLSLVDQGSFNGHEQNILRGVILSPKAGDVVTYTFQAQCSAAIKYQLVGIAETKGSYVLETASVDCGN